MSINLRGALYWSWEGFGVFQKALDSLPFLREIGMYKIQRKNDQSKTNNTKIYITFEKIWNYNLTIE